MVAGPTGRVRSVKIRTKLKKPVVGRCIASAVRRARFRKTRRGRTFTFPFRL